MHAKARPAVAGGVVEAKRGFERWRRGRKRRRPIPERLWRLAAKVASVHGVHATARQLRLNPTRLRAWMETLRQDQAAEVSPRFVELPGLEAAHGACECILEAEDLAGRKLRIHLKGEATRQAAALGQLLWRAEG